MDVLRCPGCLERDARIAELQARLRGRRASFVRAPVALVCLLGALYLLSRGFSDVVYAVSSPQPLTLGREGEYRFDALLLTDPEDAPGGQVAATRDAYLAAHPAGQAEVLAGVEAVRRRLRALLAPGDTLLLKGPRHSGIERRLVDRRDAGHQKSSVVSMKRGAMVLMEACPCVGAVRAIAFHSLERTTRSTSSRRTSSGER